MPKKRLTAEAVAQFLVTLRNSTGVTQSALAEKLGKPQSFVSKYETGERYLDFVDVVEILEALERDPVVEFRRLYTGH